MCGARAGRRDKRTAGRLRQHGGGGFAGAPGDGLCLFYGLARGLGGAAAARDTAVALYVLALDAVLQKLSTSSEALQVASVLDRPAEVLQHWRDLSAFRDLGLELQELPVAGLLAVSKLAGLRKTLLAGGVLDERHYGDSQEFLALLEELEVSVLVWGQATDCNFLLPAEDGLTDEQAAQLVVGSPEVVQAMLLYSPSGVSGHYDVVAMKAERPSGAAAWARVEDRLRGSALVAALGCPDSHGLICILNEHVARLQARSSQVEGVMLAREAIAEQEAVAREGSSDGSSNFVWEVAGQRRESELSGAQAEELSGEIDKGLLDQDTQSSAASSACEDEGRESLSAASTLSDLDEEDIMTSVCVEAGGKTWQTRGDEDEAAIATLALCLRARPLLPPHPDNAEESWLDCAGGVKFPLSHCAFRGCVWASQRRPCEQRSVTTTLLTSQQARWVDLPPAPWRPSGVYGCCGDQSCLKEHLVEAHLPELISACGRDRARRHSWDYYLEAVAWQEAEHMPAVGPSVDRRAFAGLREDVNDVALQGLVCLCCAQVKCSGNGFNADVAYIPAAKYFGRITATSFQWNWDFAHYKKTYGEGPSLRDLPQLQRESWENRRRLSFGKWAGKEILCCPEDISCAAMHGVAELCPACLIPICRPCLMVSQSSVAAEARVPAALANDNFWGFPPALVYQHKVRWIESAAASPVFTCLITYYLEADRGHLLQESLQNPKHPVNVRGNVYSFHMPWEDIALALARVGAEPAWDNQLPHDEQVLAHMVQFNLRVQ